MSVSAPRCVAALLVVLVASGCTSSAEPSIDYEPVDDQALFQQVEDLPEVRSAELDYEDSFTHPSEYFGEVTIRPTADPVETLDAISAILWQGRPDPKVIVTVRSPRTEIDNASIRLMNPTDLEERYGPQPGTGEVPDDAEPLTRPPGVR